MESALRKPLLKNALPKCADESQESSPDGYSEDGKASPGCVEKRQNRPSIAGITMAKDTAHRWTGKVKDRLHDAQVNLLHKTEDRHAIYSGPQQPTPEKRTSVYRPDHLPEAPQQAPPPDTETWQICGRPRSSSDAEAHPPLPSNWVKAKSRHLSFEDDNLSGKVGPVPETRQAIIKRLTSSVSSVRKSMAYMGIDWYQMQERQKRLSWLFFIENLYFWCYAGYIVTAILVGAVLIWALEPNGQLSFAQSVYSAAACVSQSGLAVVDWSKQSRSTYIISFLLIISGSASLMHMAPVVLRRLSFRMQTRMTEKLQEVLSKSDKLSGADSTFIPKPARFQRAYSDPGLCPLGLLDKVHEEDASPRRSEAMTRTRTEVRAAQPQTDREQQRRRTIMFTGLASSIGEDSASEDSRGSSPARPTGGKKHTCSDKLSENHRLEYKALGKVLKIMTMYWLTVHAMGWSIFFAYFEFGSGRIQDKFREEGLTSHWHAAYLTVSSFQNNGLVMTPSSVMDFRWSPLLLNTIGALILCGNTCLPIAIRLIAWFLARHAKEGSEQRRVLDFLLEHPRRCFTHMFPAVHTLWLLLVVVTLNLLQTAIMLWQDSDGKAFRWWDDQLQAEQEMSSMDRFWNSLFQAMSTRTAGLNSVNVADLSQGTTFVMVVMMYFSTTPTVVTMRHSATGVDGHAELDITGRAEGVDEEVLLGDNSLKSQARRYLTQDITYLVFILFLICVFEKNNFAISAKEITPDSDGIYGDFSFFKVLFELVSAYGTCGFSLGYRNQTSSFSGMWSPASQYLLVVVMVLGRLRGLPDSIDPSVKVAMAHGEHTEHAFMHA